MILLPQSKWGNCGALLSPHNDVYPSFPLSSNILKQQLKNLLDSELQRIIKNERNKDVIGKKFGFVSLTTSFTMEEIILASSSVKQITVEIRFQKNIHRR